MRSVDHRSPGRRGRQRRGPDTTQGRRGDAAGRPGRSCGADGTITRGRRPELPDPRSDLPFCGRWTPCVYLSAEDSTSGLCHTPGTREGVKSHRGSNPLSSANGNPRSIGPGVPSCPGWGRSRARIRGTGQFGVNGQNVCLLPACRGDRGGGRGPCHVADPLVGRSPSDDQDLCHRARTSAALRWLGLTPVWWTP